MNSASTEYDLGGVPRKPSDTTKPSFQCKICDQYLLEPIQLNCCGERLCKFCASYAMAKETNSQCPYCDDILDLNEASPDRGVAREMRESNFECYLCNWTGKYESYQNHLNESHKIFQCHDCQELFSTKNHLKHHILDYCTETMIPCHIENCIDSVKRKDLLEHYLSEQHQFLLTQTILENADENIRHHFNEYFGSNLADREGDVKSINEILPEMNQKIEILRECDEKRRVDLKNYESLLMKFHNEANEPSQIVTGVNECIKLQEDIEKALEEIEKNAYKKPDILLDDQSKAIFSINKQNLSELQYFRTSSCGMRFSLRTCETADESTNSVPFLSVYLRLVCSEFDAIIRFPFSYDIYFVLLDQSKKQDFVKKYETNSQSRSMARPSKDHENPEFGIKDFYPISQLFNPGNNFERNGTFYIAVYIDYLRTGIIPINFQ